jgi:hypothetical protein
MSMDEKNEVPDKEEAKEELPYAGASSNTKMTEEEKKLTLLKARNIRLQYSSYLIR